eukprot:6120192-Amphidinium_carterae.2
MRDGSRAPIEARHRTFHAVDMELARTSLNRLSKAYRTQTVPSVRQCYVKFQRIRRHVGDLDSLLLLHHHRLELKHQCDGHAGRETSRQNRHLSHAQFELHTTNTTRGGVLEVLCWMCKDAPPVLDRNLPLDPPPLQQHLVRIDFVSRLQCPDFNEVFEFRIEVIDLQRCPR